MSFRHAGLMMLLIAVPLHAQPAATKEDRKKEFTALKEKFEKAVNNVQKLAKEAKSPKEREDAINKHAPRIEEYLPKVLKLIEVDPKDDLALEMLIFCIRELDPETPKLYEWLAEHHAENAKVEPICEYFHTGGPPDATKFLEKVLAKNPNKNARGFACSGLAFMKLGIAEQSGDAKESAAAEQLFDQLMKEFATVKIDAKETLGDIAKGPLFSLKSLAIGKAAPEIGGTNLQSKKEKLSEYRGKVVVLDVWATWCGPCRQMIPHSREMVKKFKDKPFAMISISADDEKADLENFLKKEPMPWIHWWDGPDGGIVKEWFISAFPTIYVLDAKGVIRFKNLRNQDLEEAVEKLLKEIEAKK